MTDTVVMIILLFIIAIVTLVIYKFSSSITDSIVNSAGITDQHAKDMIQEQNDRFDNTFDYMFLTLYIGLVISLIAISYVLPTNPVYLFLMIILFIIVVATTGYFANAFIETSNTEALSTITISFPITNFIMTHYLVLNVIAIFLIFIAYFAKPSEAL